MSLQLACSRVPRAWVVALLLAALPTEVFAQATPAEPPGYRAAVDEAIAEHAAGRYPEARALFMRAHTLQPSARTLRGLGMTEFELRNYVEAARMLQDALTSTVRPLEGELRTATEALLGRARGFIGRYALALTPPTLQLSVDGAPARLEPDRSLALGVGDHALHAQAEGHVAISHTLRVNGGENTTLNITLQKEQPAPVAVAPVTPPSAVQPAQPPPPAVTPTSPTQPRDEESSSVFSSPIFWTIAAVVVVGAGVGATLLLLNKDAEVEPTHGGSTGVVLSAP